MSIISKITMTDSVAVVTLENVPADSQFLSALFELIEKEGINVDMISLATPKSPTTTLSFSVVQNKVTQILKATKQIENYKKNIRISVSIGNVKFSIFGEDMPYHIGVCAKVFNVISKKRLEPLLVTTSDFDISVVVQYSDCDELYNYLKDNLLD